MKTVGMGTEKNLVTENDSELKAELEELISENEALHVVIGTLEAKIEELIAENESLKEARAEKAKK